MTEKSAWWKEAAVYQIYPRSFQDSNGDGIGDLRGILRRLDYIQELGVDVLWLNPIYQSPNDDNGYDISDYRAIMPEFGTMEDFEELLAQAHARGIHVVLDLVVNHTSDEHAWFIESRRSPPNRYRDYYIWRPGRGKQPPNNWGSTFRGPAWQYDAEAEAYYLHLFSAKQPDLNWENPELRQEIYAMMRFWLDKGIDGFRMDVINYLSKTEGMPDGPMKQLYGDFVPYAVNGPRIHAYLQEMNREVLSHYDIMTVGEMPHVTAEQARLYTDPQREELNMVFQFEHMYLDYGEYGKWDTRRYRLRDLKAVLSKWQEQLNDKGWNSLYWNNHDQPRVVSRFGDDTAPESWRRSAKMLAVCLYFMKGTPFIYQGEELGMTNAPFASIEEYRDVDTRNAYREMVTELGIAPEDMMRRIHAKSRDNARTPMQWDDSPHAGFTEAVPWIDLNPNYRSINAAAQQKDPNSILAFYRRLLTLRKKHRLFWYGDYTLLDPESAETFSYRRSLDGQSAVIICNFTDNSVFCPVEEKPEWLPLLGNLKEEAWRWGTLCPYEARVYLVPTDSEGE